MLALEDLLPNQFIIEFKLTYVQLYIDRIKNFLYAVECANKVSERELRTEEAVESLLGALGCRVERMDNDHELDT